MSDNYERPQLAVAAVCYATLLHTTKQAYYAKVCDLVLSDRVDFNKDNSCLAKLTLALPS